MELIKDLPSIFEEFAEQRQNSFLAVKDLKEQNLPVIGAFCTYFPQELPLAMGAAVVSLCSSSNETVEEAEKDLPRNLCPLIKSSYGFAKTDKCPFFYFSDLVVGETTCDGKKKMYEQLGEIKNVHVMEMPNSQNEAGVKLFRDEIVKFKERLEKEFNVTITEEQIREATKLKNKERQALKDFYEVMKHDPAPITGHQMYDVLIGSTFKFDKEASVDEINAVTKKIEQEYAEGNHLEKKPRIVITGSPSAGAAMKVVKAIEENGGVVVAFENCGGIKGNEGMVDENADDIYMALAERYMNIPCSCMTPNQGRFDLLGQIIEDYKADAVVEIVLQACHTYALEGNKIRDYVNKEHDIPYLAIETDYSSEDVGQITTRVTALIEML